MTRLLAQVHARFPLVALLVISAGYVAFAVYLAWDEGQDDAAISFAYAKNLVHGNGLVLSQGADAVEGYTNFLWVLAIAPAIAAGLDAMLTAKIVGLLLSLATLFLLARIPGQVEQRPMKTLDLLAPALTALALPFALWSISGLENPLMGFLLVLVVSLTIRELKDPRAFPWSSAAFVALALTRPEGTAFWLGAVAHRVFLAVLRRRRLRQDGIWAAVFLAALVVYHVWHYSYFGELVPNTYFAKADHRSVIDLFSYATNSSDPGFQYIKSFVSDYWLLPLLPIIPVSVLGRRGFTYYGLPLLLLATGVSAVLYEGGDWMRYHRFMSPLIPLFYLAVQEGIRPLLRIDGRRLPRFGCARVTTIGRPIIIAAMLAMALTVSVTKAGAAHASPFNGEYTLVKAQAEQLEKLAERLPVARASILLPDIGAIAYHTDLFIIDLGGLADPFIARHPSGLALANYVFGERRPDIISLHEPWVRGLDRDQRLWDDYAPVTLDRRPDADMSLSGGLFVRKDLVLVDGSCPDALRWDDESLRAGKLATVRGRVVSGQLTRNAGHVILDLGEPGGFAAVVRAGDRGNFVVAPELAYVDETVCVTGVIERFGGRLLMGVENPDAIIVENRTITW